MTFTKPAIDIDTQIALLRSRGLTIANENHARHYLRFIRYYRLSGYALVDLEQIQEHTTDWMWMYNHERPNMAIGGITPKMKLAMKAKLYFRSPLKMGGLPIHISNAFTGIFCYPRFFESLDAEL